MITTPRRGEQPATARSAPHHTMTDHELALKFLKYRRSVVRWMKHAGAGHTGGSLSCAEILNVLYNRVLRVSPETFSDPKRDRYIQSKGHSVEALFVVLADRGLFPESDLGTLCAYRSRAALESIGYQLRDVLDSMRAETGVSLQCLHGDGGATANRFFMQFCSDVTGVELRVANNPNLSALGAAWMGMLGLNIYARLTDLSELPQEELIYRPTVGTTVAAEWLQGWHTAVSHVLKPPSPAR